jgi:hypothetical protein
MALLHGGTLDSSVSQHQEAIERFSVTLVLSDLSHKKILRNLNIWLIYCDYASSQSFDGCFLHIAG